MPLLEVDFWEMAKSSEPVPLAVMAILILFSVLSWTVILSKVSGFSRAKRRNLAFLRMFRKTPGALGLRYLLGPAYPRRVNRAALAKAAKRERSGQR